MYAVLRADFLHRARRLADGGAAGPFDDIDPGLERQPGAGFLTVDVFPASATTRPSTEVG
ncbi:hypothetical protein [Streptomyces sp. NPDC001153]